MKRSVLLLVFISLILASCKNDVQILAPYKEIPVVYGLLDQSDTTHYIRVNRAFQGIGNSYTMAQQYDSINYPIGAITVQLQNLSNSSVITLSPTTAIPVDSGIFSYPNQVIYYTHQKLDSSVKYKLIVTNNKTGKTCTGTTGLLPDVAFTQPNTFMTATPISFTYFAPFPPASVTWVSDSAASIYQLVFRFFYNEIDTVKKDTAHNYADWIFPPQTISLGQAGTPLTASYSGNAFLQFLISELAPAAPRPIKRVPQKVQVRFSSGSVDFYTYIELSQPSLTANQQKPFFSDVTNGVGIFSSRHTQTVFRPLSASTINVLDTDALVKSLNFKSN